MGLRTYTFTDTLTGDDISFDWDGDDEPTEDVYLQVADQGYKIRGEQKAHEQRTRQNWALTREAEEEENLPLYERFVNSLLPEGAERARTGWNQETAARGAQASTKIGASGPALGASRSDYSLNDALKAGAQLARGALNLTFPVANLFPDTNLETDIGKDTKLPIDQLGKLGNFTAQVVDGMAGFLEDQLRTSIAVGGTDITGRMNPVSSAVLKGRWYDPFDVRGTTKDLLEATSGAGGSIDPLIEGAKGASAEYLERTAPSFLQPEQLVLGAASKVGNVLHKANLASKVAIDALGKDALLATKLAQDAASIGDVTTTQLAIGQVTKLASEIDKAQRSLPRKEFARRLIVAVDVGGGMGQAALMGPDIIKAVANGDRAEATIQTLQALTGLLAGPAQVAGEWPKIKSTAPPGEAIKGLLEGLPEEAEANFNAPIRADKLDFTPTVPPLTSSEKPIVVATTDPVKDANTRATNYIESLKESDPELYSRLMSGDVTPEDAKAIFDKVPDPQLTKLGPTTKPSEPFNSIQFPTRKPLPQLEDLSKHSDATLKLIKEQYTQRLAKARTKAERDQLEADIYNIDAEEERRYQVRPQEKTTAPPSQEMIPSKYERLDPSISDTEIFGLRGKARKDPSIEERFRATLEKRATSAEESIRKILTGTDPNEGITVGSRLFLHAVDWAASKMLLKAMDLKDFTVEAVAKLGERVRPVVKDLYNEAKLRMRTLANPSVGLIDPVTDAILNAPMKKGLRLNGKMWERYLSNRVSQPELIDLRPFLEENYNKEITQDDLLGKYREVRPDTKIQVYSGSMLDARESGSWLRGGKERREVVVRDTKSSFVGKHHGDKPGTIGWSMVSEDPDSPGTLRIEQVQRDLMPAWREGKAKYEHGWQERVLNATIKYAVEEGYDSILLVPGGSQHKLVNRDPVLTGMYKKAANHLKSIGVATDLDYTVYTSDYTGEYRPKTVKAIKLELSDLVNQQLYTNRGGRVAQPKTRTTILGSEESATEKPRLTKDEQASLDYFLKMADTFDKNWRKYGATVVGDSKKLEQAISDTKGGDEWIGGSHVFHLDSGALGPDDLPYHAQMAIKSGVIKEPSLLVWKNDSGELNTRLIDRSTIKAPLEAIRKEARANLNEKFSYAEEGYDDIVDIIDELTSSPDILAEVYKSRSKDKGPYQDTITKAALVHIVRAARDLGIPVNTIRDNDNVHTIGYEFPTIEVLDKLSQPKHNSIFGSETGAIRLGMLVPDIFGKKDKGPKPTKVEQSPEELSASIAELHAMIARKGVKPSSPPPGSPESIGKGPASPASGRSPLLPGVGSLTGPPPPISNPGAPGGHVANQPQSQAQSAGAREAIRLFGSLDKSLSDLMEEWKVTNRQLDIVSEHHDEIIGTGTIRDQARKEEIRKEGLAPKSATYDVGISEQQIDALGQRLKIAKNDLDKAREAVDKTGNQDAIGLMAAAKVNYETAEKMWMAGRTIAGRGLKAWDRAAREVFGTHLKSINDTLKPIPQMIRDPIFTNILNNLPRIRQLSSLEKQHLYEDITNTIRLPFSITSPILDFITNSTEYGLHVARNVGHDVAWSYNTGKISAPALWATAEAMKYRWQHRFEPLRPEIEAAFGTGLAGYDPKIGGRGLDVLRASEAFEKEGIAGLKKALMATKGTWTMRDHVASMLLDYTHGIGGYTKAAEDTFFKRLTATEYMLREGYKEGLRRGITDYTSLQKIAHSYVERPPEAVRNEAIRRGNIAGFNRELPNKGYLGTFVRGYTHNLWVKLLVDSFPRFTVQNLAWALDVTGVDTAFSSKVRAEWEAMPVEDQVGKIFGVAASWTAMLGLMTSALQDHIDYDTMEYIDPISKQAIPMRTSPVAEAIFTTVMIRAGVNYASGNKEEGGKWLANAQKVLNYVSLPGSAAATGRDGGLLGSVAKGLRHFAESKGRSSNELRDAAYRIFARATPGSPVLIPIESFIDPDQRTGPLAHIPGLSTYGELKASLTGKDPKRNTYEWMGLTFTVAPGMAVSGSYVPGIGPVGPRRRVSTAEAIMQEYDVPINQYPHQSIRGISGGPYSGKSFRASAWPEKLKNEWKMEYGTQREGMFTQTFLDQLRSIEKSSGKATANDIARKRDGLARYHASNAIFTRYKLYSTRLPSDPIGVEVDSPDYRDRQRTQPPPSPTY